MTSSKASLCGIFRNHLNHLSQTAGLHKSFTLPSHVPNTVSLLREFSRAEKFPTSQNQIPTLYFKCTKGPGTCQNHSNSIQKLHKFWMGFFFPFWFLVWFGTDVWHPCSDPEEGASFPGPALLHICWPTTKNRPGAPGLFTVQNVSQGWLWPSSNFTFSGLAK